MRVEELSIGDWVNVLNYHWDGRPYTGQVNGITKKHGTYYLQFGSSLSAEIDRCEPIPITLEILERNGFKYDYDVDECVADGGHYITMKGYMWEGENVMADYCNGRIRVHNELVAEISMDAEYVHQLQHALNLCGITKNIEL